MMRFIILIIGFILALDLKAAEEINFPIGGKFQVYIDDSIHLFLNGREILAKNIWTVLQSEEVQIKPGDRIVAHLRN